MATPARSAKVRLLYSKHNLNARGHISLNVTREICTYIADFMLVQVSPTFLRFFHPCYQWTPQVPLRSRISVDEESSWVLLEDGRLFCSGGGEMSGELQDGLGVAYLLGRDGATDELPHMLSARYYHGVIGSGNFVYVFGGYNAEGMYYSGRLKICEKIELLSRRWRALPDMKEGRRCFNPCDWDGYIYLCGAGSLHVEVFYPRNDQFLPLQVSLPETDYGCTLYVHNNLLVVHSENFIVKFSAGEAGQLEQYSQVKSQAAMYKYTNSQPVVAPASGYFFIFQKRKCLCLSMETGAEVQSFY